MEQTLTTPAITVSDDLFSTILNTTISHSVLSLLPYSLAVEHFALPLGFDNKGRLQVLMAYPSDPELLQKIQFHTGKTVRPKAMGRDQVLKLIAHHYGPQVESSSRKDQMTSEKKFNFGATDSTINIVNDIIHEGIRLRASDIHLEPFEREMTVRFRIDGVLHEMTSVPKNRVPEVISRVKVIANMDIAERRRAQDGRIRINENGKDVDIRVSTLPTDFGEKAVLRLLNKSNFDFGLESIGMDPDRLAIFRRAVQAPNGIVLLTGPTGSGKSTSLYSVINYIKRPGINISTVEDPIEYNIPGVNQTQVNVTTGVTFANSLRTLLRQDPDVIMVGEMRDPETSEIAIRASLTGHLVLSTLHTNDSPSAITRLIDMGIEPYLVSSSVTLIVAQRLVRKICTHCKCETNVSNDIKKSLGLAAGVPLYKGLGCSVCGYTGYRGRIGIFEVLPVSDNIRKLINEKAYAAEIRDAALKEGLVVLKDNALSRLVDGVTSVEGVLREISDIS